MAYNTQAAQKAKKKLPTPYDFIPLEQKCERGKYKKGNYTGFLECTMELLSPLFIPNTSTPFVLTDEAEYKEKIKGYEFFSYDDLSAEESSRSKEPPNAPVIPGSEIRGAVRSVYEAAFNGCMSSLYEERELREELRANKKGRLVCYEGKWFVKYCDVLKINVTDEPGEDGTTVSTAEYDSWREGKKLKYQVGSDQHTAVNISALGYDEEVDGDWKYGWLHKEACSGDKRMGVVIRTTKKEGCPVECEEIEHLAECAEAYRGEITAAYMNALKRKTGNKFVYWCERNKRVYLSPIMNGLCMGKHVGEIIEKNGNYLPCRDVDHLCPGCAVFGMVSKEKGARGSRVRFTDAHLTRPLDGKMSENFYDPCKLKFTQQPDPKAARLYTLKPQVRSLGEKKNVTKWGYMEANAGKEVYGLRADQPRIKGRKFYRHSDTWSADHMMNTGAIKDKKEHRIRPLHESDPSSEKRIFAFKVYFENMSREELSRLKWSLDFGDSRCAHKIGQAKQWGFGSVKIHVNQLNIRSIDAETGLWQTKSEKPETFLPPITPDQYKSIVLVRKMADWESRPKQVKYDVIAWEKKK